ncbi:MAG: Uncharacterized protein G01um10148_526 [Parcubacteria group bacterium Gr01-1014_8]|nr:MAG: Uncharacterized protein G01um10148_526 [Parcubacteria group bacterium Gr01-1014_8]
MQERIEAIERELEAIKQRNSRVEGDKAWETSPVRAAILAAITFVVTSAGLMMIDNENPFRNGIIAAIGYVLSTLSFSFLKRRWIVSYVARLGKK